MGAPFGMKTVDLMPSAVAASATPCAWLPALAATTPRARSSSLSVDMRFVAPRSLNAPVRCRFSALSSTRVPVQREIAPAESTGVGVTTPSMTVRARLMSSRPTTPAIVVSGPSDQGQHTGQVVGVVARVGVRTPHEQCLHAGALGAGDVGLVRVTDEEDL